MSSNRRKFLRNITLGTGALAAGLPSIASAESNGGQILEKAYEKASGTQRFNMCGYAAPKIEKVHIGFIGLGMRGGDAVQLMAYTDGIEIKVLCDKYEDRVAKSQAALEKRGFQKPKAYSGNDGWKAMIEKEELDLVYICTPWSLHTPMSVHAMKLGKHVACEVPITKTLDECWELQSFGGNQFKACQRLVVGS